MEAFAPYIEMETVFQGTAADTPVDSTKREKL